MNSNETDFFVTSPDRTSSPAGGDAHSSPLAHIIERYWNRLWSNIWIVAAIVAATLIAALAFTLLATPYFTAVSRIEINREQANVTNVEGIESDASNQDLEFYQTQYSLLEARTVAERVAREMSAITNDRLFDAYEIDIDTIVAARTSAPGVEVSTAQARLDAAADVLMENVSINPVRGSRLVDVGYTSPSAKLSAEVANEWVEQFQTLTIERRFQSSADAREFLEDQLAELRQRLEDSQRQLVSFAADREIIPLADNRDVEGNTSTTETLVSTNLKALNDALNQAVQERIIAESRMRQSSSSSERSLANPALNGIREKRAEVAAELARLSATFAPEYPLVQGLQSQLDELDRSIAREEGRINSSDTLAYRQALAREQQLAARVQALKSQTLNERRDSIQFAIYQREVDTNRELYDGLLQRYKEIGVAGVGSSNITVVDPALVPNAPSGPSLPLNMALGLILGLGMAGGFVFLREQLDQSLRDPQQVESELGLTLIGAIPDDRSGEVVDQLEDVKSVLSEAYFASTSNITFLTSHGAPSSVAITSTRPNEGKSTSAYALALSLARTGRRVLLVDADLRNASQHAMFGVENKYGLANLLTGANPEEGEPVVATKWDNLFLMPSGPLPPEPGALLSGDRLRELVDYYTQRFDHVIVDSPPMLGLADAPLLARAVEGVIYTIEANGLKLKSIRAGLQRLRGVDSPIFGALVTKLTSANSAYGYGEYGYGYEYAKKS